MSPDIERPDLITILGPTATGKTALAAVLADRINSEVISADSRQVYRGMTIGTGKDYSDYIVQGRRVPYHLVDIMDAGSEYHVFAYQRDFLKVYDTIRSQGKLPVLCGGSGMYLDAVLKGYRMDAVPYNEALRGEMANQSDQDLRGRLEAMRQLHNVSDISDRKRLERAVEIAVFQQAHAEETPFPAIRSINFGIHFERTELRARITERLMKRLGEGLVEEVKGLMDAGVPIETLKYYGLEYRQVTSYLIGEISLDEMFSSLNTAIHQFAKRQMTWFRRMERSGIAIHWLDGNLATEAKVQAILSLTGLA